MIIRILETTYGQDQGYHHHYHMIISTGADGNQIKVEDTFTPYWRKQIDASMAVIPFDQPTMKLELINTPNKRRIAESNQEVESRFTKEELEEILHSYETDELPEHPILKEETLRVPKEL